MSTGEFTSNLAKSTPLKRLQGGLASTLILQILTAVEAFLLVPLFLRAWGASGYGEWLTLTAFISYLMLVNLGVQNYVANLLTMSYAAGDVVSFRRYLNETVSLFVLICSILMMVILAVIMIPGITIPGIDHALTLEQRLIVAFMAASYLLSVVGGVWATPYQATGRYVRGAMIGNIWGVIKLAVLISALVLRGSPVLFAFLYSSISFLRLIYYLADMHLKVHEARHVHLTISNAFQGRKYLGGSIFFWFRSLANGLNQQGVVSVLAASLPSAMISLYATHRTASGLVRYPFALVQGPLWPELSMLGGQKRFEKLREITLLVVRAIVFVSGLAALAIWIWLPVIYRSWTSSELQFEAPLLALFLFQVVLFAGWSASAWPLLATNQHKRIAVWDIVNAVFTLVLSLILIRSLDIYGVAIATLSGDVLFGFLVYPRLTAKHLEFPVIDIYRAILEPMVLAGPIVVLMGLASHLVDGWYLSLISSLIVALAAIPLSLLTFGKDNVIRSIRFVLNTRLAMRFLLARGATSNR